MLRLASCTAVLSLVVALGCGPGGPGEDETQASSANAGDGDSGDGDQSDSTSTDSNSSETGDDGDWGGDGDGDPCEVLGFVMAFCDNELFGCLDDWTCHFYDATDRSGRTPVGNCSPPCETDLDCEYGVGADVCIDPNIICAAYGPQHIKRCMLPCETDGDCYLSQFCAPELGLCLSHGP